MRGQLNMFDFVHSLEEITGEVEMVSLVPEFSEPEVVSFEPELIEPEVTETPVVKSLDKPSEEKVAMSRRYQIDGKEVEIAYINYNIVRITKEGEPPIIKQFASTKEAVDFYVEQIQEEDTDE